jgi:hypothetical protein
MQIGQKIVIIRVYNNDNDNIKNIIIAVSVNSNSNKTVYEDLFPFLPATFKQVKYAQ